jgi:hypothetical protein
VRAWDSTGAFGSQVLSLNAAGCSGVCVTVTSPTVTQSVPTPVRFTASAVDGNGYAIAGFIVYADNVKVYRNWSSSLDTWVILPEGSHSIYIRAWDSTGAYGTSATFPIGVQDTTVPTPLAGSANFPNLDDASGWGSCGDTGCAGGGANATSFTLTQNVSSPSKDGGSAEIAITGPPYADALWWNKLGAQDTKTNYLWDFWFYVPDSANSAQALEFDVWQSTSISGVMKKFMFGTQCDYVHQVWDYWNPAQGQWVSTGISCPKFQTNTWHHLIYFVQRIGDSRDTLLYGNVTLDGVTTQWNITAAPETTNWAAGTGVQHQLDIGASGTSLTEWFDLEQLTTW